MQTIEEDQQKCMCVVCFYTSTPDFRHIRLNAQVIWGSVCSLTSEVTVAKGTMKRERSGNCQCWAGNYDGEAVQRRCCRLTLSSLILPFFLRNFVCSGLNEPIDFFGNLVHNNSCSKQHHIDSDVTFVKQKVGPGQTAQCSHQKIRVSTSTWQRYTDFMKLLSSEPSGNYGV